MDAPRGSQLSSQALLNVLDWLKVAVKDLPEEEDVGDGQPQGVDLGQPLLVGKSWNMAPQFLKGRIDTCATKIYNILERGYQWIF